MKTVWMTVHHPQQVVFATAVAVLLKKKGLNTNLIVAKHGYWNRYLVKILKINFFKIVFIKPPKRYKVFDVWLFITMFLFPLVKANRQVKNLKIQPNDPIICFSGAYSLIENLLISLYSKNKSIYFGSWYKYKFDLKGRGTGKIIVSSLYHFVHRLFSLQLLNHYPPVSPRPKLITYQKTPSEIYDHVFITKNITLKQFASNEIPYPQIILRPSTANNKQKKVYLFGSDIHLKDNQKNITIVNQILNFLRDHYSKCQLIYFPHPIEIIDKKSFNFKDFSINKNSAQAMFLEKSENILAVFSFFSTASLSALNYGFNSYSFLKLFDTSKDPGFKHRYQEYYGKVPQGFYITNLIKKPKPYLNFKRYQQLFNNTHKQLNSKLINYLYP